MKSQLKKKKNYVWYIILVFRLDCTYNNCRRFHHLIYYQYKINNFIIILSLHYYPYLHKSPQISLSLSPQISSYPYLLSFLFFLTVSLFTSLLSLFFFFSPFLLFLIRTITQTIRHTPLPITSTLLSSQKIILTQKF